MITLVMWLLIIALVYVGWRWHKNGTLIEELFRPIQLALRKGLGAADRETVRNIQEQLNQVQKQLDARLLTLETQHPSEYQSPTPKVLEEQELPDVTSEVGSAPVGSFRGPSSVHVSLTWQGLRFTLSDWFWIHVGNTTSAQVTDKQLSSMIHGPFCPGCLKRWVDRAPNSSAFVVPSICPSCGISWNNGPFLYDSPLHVMDLKRRVYEHLRQENPNPTSESFLNNP
ncbi:MAG: hypothetical protein AB7F90_11350 [Nitrospirales bacterium]